MNRRYHNHHTILTHTARDGACHSCIRSILEHITSSMANESGHSDLKVTLIVSSTFSSGSPCLWFQSPFIFEYSELSVVEHDQDHRF